MARPSRPVLALAVLAACACLLAQLVAFVATPTPYAPRRSCLRAGTAEGRSQADLDNHANQLNPNNDAYNGDDDDDDDDDMGPMPAPPPAATKAKKKKVLKNAHVYLDNLPKAEMYEKSFMHRDTVSFAISSHSTGFLVTGSVDGHIKFWKKQYEGIEFVKHFRSHMGTLLAMALSQDGRLLATVGDDNALKLYEVAAFDMTSMLKLPFKPLCAEFVHKKNSPAALVAVSVADSGLVHILSPESGSPEPVRTLEVHSAPAHSIRYNPVIHTCLSADNTGALELWDPDTLQMPTEETRPGRLRFSFKSETHLYELLKNQTHAVSLSISSDGAFFVAVCEDARLRIFRFATAKMFRAYDESLEMFTAAQSDPNMLDLHLDRFDFGRRIAVEKEMRKSTALMYQQAHFDESCNFLIYPSMVGIKIVNIHTNKLVRVLGKVEQTERFLGVALFQPKPQKKKVEQGVAVVEGQNDSKEMADPLAICTAYKKQRFFIFSTREPPETTADYGRDIFNEKPTKEDAAVAASIRTENPLGKQATIHTTMGDIVVKLFFQECPKTVENFTVHSKNGYYDNTVFHRVIQGFMIQTGDPQGDGTGGESIWGGEFEDEFHRSLKHDRPFTLSMANAGPNTNGSQFFITTAVTDWLNGKHVVFGEVMEGMDVLQKMEGLGSQSGRTRAQVAIGDSGAL
uniref:peptidylprolyl isomerase n=1 Tax=Alexandrium catenella TaxID=2925 RepID=A0A7S1KV78_ALECA|mmetsp:Transcript_100143/g.266193  ORF Transcript_100143/g.266193 Transcript_100143/m.266193 type:complete len:684 (+) Transcript_100143:61-2112(+)